ncbi:MAG: recombinase family protein [Anaerolineae bacterium]
MMKRAVLYARVSSDDTRREGRNLAGQLNMCRGYAQQHGYIIVDELAEDDRGASGVLLDLPQLNRVREMAAAKAFDVLVVREIDRLSRNLAKQLIIEQELKATSVQIEYVLGEYPDTPEGELQKNIKASIAEYERLKIVERMKRGRRLKAESGSVIPIPPPPYGYNYVTNGRHYQLEIREAEAETVRRIFQWYTEGDGEQGPMSITGITRKLSELAIPTWADVRERTGGVKKKRARGQWCRGMVYKILSSETYAGIWTYSDVRVVVPAIVPREVWEAAQERRAYNKEHSSRNTKHQYLLAKRLRCGKCGYKLYGYTTRGRHNLYAYYCCPAATDPRPAPHECDLSATRCERADTAAWQWIKSFLVNPEKLRTGLEEHRLHLEKQLTPLQDRRKVVEKLIDDNKGQLGRLLDLYLSDGLPRDMMSERKNRLETTLHALEAERASIDAQLEIQMVTAAQMEGIDEFAAKVAQGLDLADQDFEVRRRIIEMLDFQGTITVENDERVMYVQCILSSSSFQIVSTSTSWPGSSTAPSRRRALTLRHTIP